MTLTDMEMLLVVVLVLAVPCMIVATAYERWSEAHPRLPVESDADDDAGEWVDLDDDPLAHIDHVPVEYGGRS